MHNLYKKLGDSQIYISCSSRTLSYPLEVKNPKTVMGHLLIVNRFCPRQIQDEHKILLHFGMRRNFDVARQTNPTVKTQDAETDRSDKDGAWDFNCAGGE